MNGVENNMAVPKGFKTLEQGEFWNPEKEGDNLQGKVIGLRDGDYGKQWLIETADKQKVWTPSHKVLQNRMETVKEGQTVYIEFTKIEPPKLRGHNPTKLYLVATQE